jgi:hypothetical protein
MEIVRAPLLASLIALACNSGTPIGEMIDAPLIDSPPIVDGPPVDSAPMGAVSVTVTVDGAAGSGVTVYFQNADSTLVSEQTTTAAGVATTTMQAGGFVTVVVPPEPAAGAAQVTAQVLDTFADVQIGDALHVDVVTTSPPPTTLSLQLMAPSDGSATTYLLFATCGAGGTDASLASPTDADIALTSCPGSGDLLLESFTAASTPLDYLQATGVALGSGSATVVMTGAYAPLAQDVVTATDVPADVASIGVLERLTTTSGVLFQGGSVALALGSGSGSAVVPTPGTGSALTAAFFYDLAPGSAEDVDIQELVQWGALPSAPIAVDVGATRLRPWTTAPTISALLEQVSWSVGSAGASPDFVVASVAAARGTGSAASTWTWNLAVGANGDGAIGYPTLPADLFDFNFRETDQLAVSSLVGVVAPGGYAAARPTVFDATPSGATLGTARLVTAGTTGNAGAQSYAAGGNFVPRSATPQPARGRARRTVR